VHSLLSVDETGRRDTLIDATVARTGLPRSHVEKDLWLTEVLRSVVRVSQESGLPVVLKGGTSLSKAHRIIERFSEDVDVLVVLDGLSSSQSKRALKRFRDGVAADIGLPGMTLERRTVWETRLVAHFAYPATSDPLLDGLRPEGVLLEIGAWGGALPSSEMELRSLVAEHSEDTIDGFRELAPVAVRVLAPERTAVEKLMLLHSVTDGARRSTSARHYYDLHRLLGNPGVRAALADGAAALLAREVHVHSRALGVPSIERPASGFHMSPAFDATDPVLATARVAYDTVVLGQLVWPDATVRPSFEECCATVRSATYL
jgi:hypothetical protein